MGYVAERFATMECAQARRLACTHLQLLHLLVCPLHPVRHQQLRVSSKVLLPAQRARGRIRVLLHVAAQQLDQTAADLLTVA